MMFASEGDGPTTGDNTPGELTASQARPEAVADILMRIIAGFNLSDYERELVLQTMNERNVTISTPRAGKTLSAIVDFIRREEPGDTFTLEDVRAALTRNAAPLTPKEIYNALGYLTRKKHIERIGYGLYQVTESGRKEA
jgi:hypothetical protein